MLLTDLFPVPVGVTTFEASVVAWSIRGALLCMFLVFALRLSRLALQGTILDLVKSFWLLGSLLSLLHALATMGFHHQFQHDLAFEDTARQTEQAIGIPIGIGIYFNYLFVIVWLADALWLNGFQKSYLSRSRYIELFVCAFLAFIAINGAIIFETGPVRWIGLVAFSCLIAIACVQRNTVGNHSEQSTDF
jgi:hypothetical protein